jgi:hypothetical protein
MKEPEKASPQTLTFTSFSGDPSFYPIRDWVNKHPSRRVEFKLVSRTPDPSIWMIEWASEEGFGHTRGFAKFEDAVAEFWEGVAGP